MARLYRPHIPTSLRISIAERQLKERSTEEWNSYLMFRSGESVKVKLALVLAYLAATFECEACDLRLDHDPPLGARPKERRGLGKKTYYIPDANSPDHLNYRPHGPQFENSHLIKTNVRGPHGQHPDRVLIKKNRQIERGPKPKRPSQFSSPQMRSKKSTWPKRKFPSRRKP